MTKKKKPTTTVVEPVTEEHPEPEPQEDVPSRQIEEVHETEPEPVEQSVEPEQVVQAESTPIVEPAAKVEPQPIVEPAPAPVPPSRPKPLTLSSLHSELEELRRIVDGQAVFIKQLMETPVRQRKSPVSNGKVQIKDTLTGRTFPSKNNAYQTLLKEGELKELVDANVFGPNPAKNSFGCYNLFRAWPNRFEEVHEELSV